MTSFIEAIGAYPNTYVLVTLRSEATMVNASNAKCAAGGDDAVCIPTSGTDATYKALVDTFKDKPYVLFDVSNEPGGNSGTQAQITSAMSHAVGTIRAEEDAQGVPHHLVSVQGLGYTSNIAFYNSAPLPYDNVVYELHGYPPPASGYTQSKIPVIIGEYGPSGSDTSFTTALYADLESKHIPNLAWDLDTYNDCSPDLANVTGTTAITPSARGAGGEGVSQRALSRRPPTRTTEGNRDERSISITRSATIRVPARRFDEGPRAMRLRPPGRPCPDRRSRRSARDRPGWRLHRDRLAPWRA